MAHTQPKTTYDQKPTESKGTTNKTQATSSDNEGISWEFKFVIAVIVSGVLMLLLKTAGLF